MTKNYSNPSGEDKVRKDGLNISLTEVEGGRLNPVGDLKESQFNDLTIKERPHLDVEPEVGRQNTNGIFIPRFCMMDRIEAKKDEKNPTHEL